MPTPVRDHSTDARLRARRRGGRARVSRRRALACALLLAGTSIASAQTVFGNGFELARPELVGGSNFHWYTLGADCDREPFGIVANYHEPLVRDLVQAQLAMLRQGGQQRISIGLYHAHADVPTSDGRISGTVLDSTGGRLHPRMRQNLVDFLADIRTAGFTEFLFRYFPLAASDVRNGSISDAIRDENWELIRDVEPLLLNSGMFHRTDLMAEGMPRAREIGSFIVPDEPSQEAWSRYARTLWQRYYREFGSDRSVGFSFVSDFDDVRIDARAEHLDYVYRVDGQRRLPPIFAFSLYGGPERDERWVFERYRKHLGDEGLGGIGWIVAEAYYDDPGAARRIAEAMTATGQRVWYLTQWPVHRDAACNDDVSVTPPHDFDQYSRYGF